MPTLWDFFAKAFEDYYQPIKESREKDLLFGPNAKQPFQFDPAAMVTGGASILAKAKELPNYANNLQKWVGRMKEMVAKDKSLFTEVNPKVPGLYSGDVLFTPEMEKMYNQTGTILLPYLSKNPNTGKLGFVPVMDAGPFTFNQGGLFDAAVEKILKGKEIPVTELGGVAGGKHMANAYQGWPNNISVKLTDDPGKLAMSGIGTAGVGYNPHARYKGRITLNRPEIFNEKNRETLYDVINHEVQHPTLSMSGLPGGSSAAVFDQTPIGLQGINPAGLYTADLGEIIARASQRRNPNMLQNIQDEIANSTKSVWGTDYPIVIREKLKHPKFGKDYSMGIEHFGTDIFDYLAKMGY